ncbi:MAG: bifunctional adenosylcobinamide kinase/adenosylcobinamide-phosphate guanylyltransferase [Tahibacter sp.]
MHSLILGGARSGKSAFAERLALTSTREVVYIATAQAGDAEMRARIAQHRAARPVGWASIEEPLRLASVLAREARVDRCLLVDCLTLWLSNLLCAEHPDSNTETEFARERAALFTVLPQLPGHVVLVSNEVGTGIVPLGALSRRYVDEAGRLHQQLAAHCGRVVFLIAGIPQVLKGTLS